jgi:hypothetical protein
MIVEFAWHTWAIGFVVESGRGVIWLADIDPSREIPPADMASAMHTEHTSDPAGMRTLTHRISVAGAFAASALH